VSTKFTLGPGVTKNDICLKITLELTYEQLSEAFEEANGFERKFTDYSKLNLNLGSDKKLGNYISQFKLPNLKVLGLLSVIEQKEVTAMLFKNSFPDEVKGFFITGDILPPRPKLSDFLPLILSVKDKIKEELWIRIFTVTRKDIETILTNFPHLKTIGFHDCSYVDMGEGFILPKDLPMQLESLSFEETLDSSLTHDNIYNILACIAKTPAKYTLRQINLTQMAYLSRSIENSLGDLGLEDVNVIANASWYFYNL